MRQKLYQSISSVNEVSLFKKFLVIIVSITFISLNTGVSFAQTTTAPEEEVTEEDGTNTDDTSDDEDTSLADVLVQIRFLARVVGW